MPEQRFPRSPYDEVDGLVYFARMLDKIRLHAEGALPETYHGNLGEGLDDRCCRFLGVAYEALKRRTLEGGTDAAVLDWARAEGARRDAEDLEVWNAFMTKRGWRDAATERLETVKRANGMAARADLVTFFDFLEADEGRKPVPADVSGTRP